MRIHNFSEPTAFGKPYAKPAFTLHGCDSIGTLRKVKGGDYCTLPDGHASCLPGFRPYRCGDGAVIGVESPA
jgi:hypothetical protein